MNPADFDEVHEVLFRLGIATLLGALVGIDRDLHRKPAGLRVLALVAVGATTATMLSVMAVGVDPHGHINILPTVQGILSGIGFLGGGVIIHGQGRREVHGLTTAAAIWVVAVIGVACGFGFWTLVGGAFIVTILVLIFGWGIEHYFLVQLESADADKPRPKQHEPRE